MGWRGEEEILKAYIVYILIGLHKSLFSRIGFEARYMISHLDSFESNIRDDIFGALIEQGNVLSTQGYHWSSLRDIL